MKRQLTRLIFPTLFLSMFVLIFEPAPVKSANLNVALSIPMKHYRVKDWYKPYADKIAKLTNGKVKLVIFASNSLVKDSGAWDAVNSGLADMAEVKIYTTPGRFTFEGIVTAGLTKGVKRSHGNDNKAVWSAYENISKVKKEFASVKTLWFFTLKGNVIYSIKPVRNLEDLKGMKLRTNSGSPAVAMGKLGAVPVSVPYGATYSAIEKGVAEGVVTSPAGAWAKKFHEVAPYITVIPSTGSITFAFVMNLKKWNSLSKEVQAVFNDMTGEMQSQRIGELADRMDSVTLQKSLNNGGKLTKLDPGEKSKWENILQVMAKDYGSQLDKTGKPGTITIQYIKKKIESY